MPQLLDSPPELLALIFSYLEDREHAGMRPISRALLPFTRRNLLARVHLGAVRPWRLQRFSRLLHPREVSEVGSLRASLVGEVPLGHYVRELYIPNLDKQWQGELYVDRAPTIKRILAELKQLEVLSVAGSDMAELLLPVADTWIFPKLRRLHLLELDPNRVGLYDMDLLNRLRRFSSLKWLEYSFSTYADDPEELHAEPPPALDIDPFGGIDTLTLSAGNSLSTSQAANFISHFTNRRTLHLSVIEGISLFSFFGAVPSQLVHLKIEYNLEVERATIHDDMASALTRHIPRFTRLESLYLGWRTWSTSLLPALIDVPMTFLSRLTLVDSDDYDNDERGPICDASLLIDFISERGGPAHALKHVTLDALFGHTGMIPSENPHRPEVVSGTFEFDDGNWYLPDWTPTFGFEGAKELVRVAAANEVKLDGTFLEAIEVHEVFLREEQYLERRRNEAARAQSEEV